MQCCLRLMYIKMKAFSKTVRIVRVNNSEPAKKYVVNFQISYE